jgi:glycosyltransferase involved in cell wall biosynthesis
VIESDPQRQNPRVSIVVPAYNEGEPIIRFLDRLLESVKLPCEVLVVYDSLTDTTRSYVEEYSNKDPRVRPTLNEYGKGPAPAIRYGFDHADAPVVVVTMADGSDDPRQVDELVYLVERGVVVAAASRYMPGGQQVGGPKIKGVLSRWAGRTLHWFAGVGTRDATNSFKAYDRAFVAAVGIDSDTAFEMGLELTAKATRLRQPVAEIPTIWLDRQHGTSNFHVLKSIPHYLRWYFFAFGRRLTVEKLRRRRARPDGMADE